MKLSEIIEALIELKMQRQPVTHGAENAEEREAKLLEIVNYRISVRELKRDIDWKFANE